jgi:hypothetical protein
MLPVLPLQRNEMWIKEIGNVVIEKYVPCANKYNRKQNNHTFQVQYHNFIVLVIVLDERILISTVISGDPV